MFDHLGLYLILVAAIGLGFMLGRRERARRRVRRVSELGRDHFRGINYLLDDRPDLAIDTFIDALPADDASIDTHLTLAAVMRRRGEFDKATRIHHNLLAREHISSENRALAELELARDYLGAGLLDRAEQLLRGLLERGGATDRVALEQLLEVYERERDWSRAVEIATQIVRRGDRDSRTALAHFHCELAEQLRERGDVDGARERLTQARRHDRDCPRIGLLLAEVELAVGRPDAARAALREVVRATPMFAAETIEGYRRACGALGEPNEFTRHLERSLAAHGDARIAAELAQRYVAGGEVDRADRLLIAELAEHPSMVGLHSLLEFVRARDGDSSEHLQAMAAFVDRVLEHRSLYRCGNCGFAGRRLLWQCPGCRKWGRFAYIAEPTPT